MCRKVFVIVSAVAFLLGVSKLSFAQDYTEHEHGVTETSNAAVSEEAVNPVRNPDKSLLNVSNGVNVGNKICPVSGEKIEEKTKSAYEYEGKIYNLCCASCIEEFKKDPQKYIKKVEEELQSASYGQPAHEGHEMGSM